MTWLQFGGQSLLADDMTLSEALNNTCKTSEIKQKVGSHGLKRGNKGTLRKRHHTTVSHNIAYSYNVKALKNRKTWESKRYLGIFPM